MSLSLVIPTFTVSDHLLGLALRAVSSYAPMCDEIIISEDGGRFSKFLSDSADIYMYGKKNVGFTKNVNRAWSMASGDYVAIVNSDTWLLAGNLQDLCIPGKVTSPIIDGQHIYGLCGSFFVVPKEIKEQRGILIDTMRTYYSDEEYSVRTKDIFVKVETVTIGHKQHQTVDAAGVNNPDESRRDKEAYEALSELHR